ncbi:MAG TPA: helix-turn-helix domain-containing protein [Streptosporangiaceae bacterium]|nr:helix-turn-helix domain-containing protein [Streptosporangiaceae bacterium]
MTHRVAVLALDSVIPFDLGIPGRVFREAVDSDGAALYEIATCSLGSRAVRTNSDYVLQIEHDESLLERADTVVIATQEPGPELVSMGHLPPDLAAALARIPSATRLVSLCTSAFVLAAAGFLDGLSATTHWALCDRLAELFPAVTVDPDVLFVDNGRVLTSAGGAAGIDLCLHLIRRDHGAEVANGAARRCVVAPWRDGGQAQFIDRPLPAESQSSTSATRAWALGHLEGPLSLAELARHAQMSVRTFSRRFRAEVGESPAQWLIQRRVDTARRLLETTDLTVEQVAGAAGFGSATLLRKHLHAVVGLSPASYRRTFVAPTAPN